MDPVFRSSTESAVAAISGAFEEALTRFQGWKKIRKTRRSGESELQDSLEAGKDDLRTKYGLLREEHGVDFEHGDEISTSSMFEIASEIQRDIIDAIDRAEFAPSHSYDDTPDLNPSFLWQRSEKIRKSATFCMGELVLRIKTRRTNQASFENNGPRLQTHANSPPLHPQTSVIDEQTRRPNQSSYENNGSRFQAHTNSPPLRPYPSVNDEQIISDHQPAPVTFIRGYYPPPVGYPTDSYPLYTQPEHVEPQHSKPHVGYPSDNHPLFTRTDHFEPQHSTPRYHDPELFDVQPNWRLPSSPSPPQNQSPPGVQTYGLPDSLRIGGHRRRPASVSMTGTGYLSRYETPAPHTEPIPQRPFASAPLPRPEAHERGSYGFGHEEKPGAHERGSYGFNQEDRGYTDARRATVGYTKPPHFNAYVEPRTWAPESPPREQPWIPTPALYSPITPPGDYLDVTGHRHFRMPTPVNYRGRNISGDDQMG